MYRGNLLTVLFGMVVGAVMRVGVGVWAAQGNRCSHAAKTGGCKRSTAALKVQLLPTLLP